MNKFMQVTNDFRGSYIQSLFDPVQTHALYGIWKDDLEEAKKILKKNGATRFRVVKVRKSDRIILCFKIKN